MLLRCHHQDNELDVDLYPHFLTPELAQALFEHLITVLQPSSKRSATLFGDPGIIYSVTYRDVTFDRPVLDWSNIKGLSELKTYVEQVTNEKYNVCIIQLYPNGSVGINPHRDKEMVAGTRITGLSLGATRTLSFTREGHQTHKIKLPSGSLYVMNQPTNQKWLHSIIKETRIKEPRLSLTFRNYPWK